MSDFSIANLRTDVEDSAKKFGFSPTLEARFGKQDLESQRLSVSYQRVAPNETSPFAHRHKEQAEEIYVVVEGSGRVLLDGERHDLEGVGCGSRCRAGRSFVRGGRRRLGRSSPSGRSIPRTTRS